ncbi:MAG: glutaredoxin family protein [Nanoarchaeota archaeon]|nr:glutaredoxin family protein [Nanoarchaeota archaeon]
MVVTIYTTPSCVYCKIAKEFFKEHDVEFEEKNVTEDDAARDAMIQKSGQMGVPVIDIGGKVVVGFNEEKIAGLLGIS